MDKTLSVEQFDDLISCAGWDSTIQYLVTHHSDNPNIVSLCKIYSEAYQTTDFQESYDADYGLCYEIREFAIEHIRKLLENS